MKMEEQTEKRAQVCSSKNSTVVSLKEAYFFLCRFFFSLFLRLCVDILCLFLFFPLGMIKNLMGYVSCYLFATLFMKTRAGLKDGMSCSGMIIVVFCEILRAVFCARLFTIKLPNPRRYTFSPAANDSFTSSMNDSTLANTVFLSIPVFLAISLTISAFVISLSIYNVRSNILDCKYIAFAKPGKSALMKLEKWGFQTYPPYSYPRSSMAVRRVSSVTSPSTSAVPAFRSTWTAFTPLS